jgi:MYXO-CTERM domain-containing protein
MKPKHRHQITFAALAAVLALTSSSVHAATALVLSGSGFANNHTGVLGGTFTANGSGTAVINRLGFYDHNGDGLTVGHDVGLYLWNGSAYTLQVKATIPAGTAATLDGGFRWVNIASYTLSATAGQMYMVYASTTASDGDLWGVTTASDSSIGTPVQSWYGSGGVGALGSTADLGGTGGSPGFIYNAGNIGYVVPEPGAALLGGLGMLALLRRRR